MQDPSLFQPVKLPFPEQEQLKCPRCDSTNTKFCYYNNYNLSQPRHFCKNCRRYWTKGGALRNVPVGGGTRKSNTKRSSNLRRPSSSSAQPTSTNSASVQPLPPPQNSGQDQSQNPAGPNDLRRTEQRRKLPEISGSFSSLLGTYGGVGGVLEGPNPNGSALRTLRFGASDGNLNSSTGAGSGPDKNPGSINISEGYLGVQNQNGEPGYWNGGNGWPDLAIDTMPRQ